MANELPITQDFERRRGDTKPFRFTVTDELGTGIDFTGYTMRLTADTNKAPEDSATQVFQIMGSSDAAGELEFYPEAADVDLVGTVYYDTQITDPQGTITTLATGKIKFKQDITK